MSVGQDDSHSAATKEPAGVSRTEDCTAVSSDQSLCQLFE